MTVMSLPIGIKHDAEVLCFTSTPVSPGLRLSLRNAFRLGDPIAVVRNGQPASIRVVDYVETAVEEGISVVATIRAAPHQAAPDG
jgi:hypothetical protein